MVTSRMLEGRGMGKEQRRGMGNVGVQGGDINGDKQDVGGKGDGEKMVQIE